MSFFCTFVSKAIASFKIQDLVVPSLAISIRTSRKHLKFLEIIAAFISEQQVINSSQSLDHPDLEYSFCWVPDHLEGHQYHLYFFGKTMRNTKLNLEEEFPDINNSLSIVYKLLYMIISEVCIVMRSDNSVIKNKIKFK